MHLRSLCGGVALFLCLAAAGQCQAGDVEVNSAAALQTALQNATPGARILVAPGTYTGTVLVNGVRGTSAGMITVAAKDPANPPVFSSNGAELLGLYSCSYIKVENMVFQGATSEQIHSNFSDHLVFNNVTSRDMNATGNADGFKFDGCNDLLFYGCTVSKWSPGGSGIDFVGCRNALIMNSNFSWAGWPTGSSGNAIQPKGGSFNMGFYKNRFESAGSRCIQFGGSTGEAYFHQGNLALGWEAYDQVAMGNVIVGGEAAIAYVSATACVAEYNTIVNPTNYVFRVLKEGGTQPTGGDTFARNLVSYTGNVVNVGANTDAASFTFANDYWYKSTNPGQSIPTLPAAETGAAGGANPNFDATYHPQYAGAQAYGAFATGMDAEWQTWVSKFQWSWDQAQLIPEPATLSLLALGWLALIRRRRA